MVRLPEIKAHYEENEKDCGEYGALSWAYWGPEIGWLITEVERLRERVDEECDAHDDLRRQLWELAGGT